MILLFLVAQLPGTTQDHLQIFNIEAKQKIKSHQMPEQVNSQFLIDKYGNFIVIPFFPSFIYFLIVCSLDLIIKYSSLEI